MEHLIGTLWIHDPGDGSVALYERIGRNYRPLRAESEPLPDRIPAEAQAIIRERLAAAAVVINARTPREVRLNRLQEALKLFPKFQELSEEDRNAFLESMSEGLPESFEEKKPETTGLPRPMSVEEQVEMANKAKQEEVSRLAAAQTENMRMAEQLAAQQAELAALKALLEKKETTNGQT